MSAGVSRRQPPILARRRPVAALELVPQAGERARETRLHRARPDSKDLGGFFFGKLQQIPARDDVAVLCRQARECMAECCPHL